MSNSMLLHSLAKHTCSPKKHWNIALACKTVTFSHKTFAFPPKNCICPQNVAFTCTIFTLSHKTFAFPRETSVFTCKTFKFFWKTFGKKHCICCQNFFSSTKRLHLLAKPWHSLKTLLHVLVKLLPFLAKCLHFLAKLQSFFILLLHFPQELCFVSEWKMGDENKVGGKIISMILSFLGDHNTFAREHFFRQIFFFREQMFCEKCKSNEIDIFFILIYPKKLSNFYLK